jgi:hypothetical protein
MTYTKQFELLEDTRQQMVRAASEKDTVRAAHSSVSSGYWPSSASILRQEMSAGSPYNIVEGACLRNVYYRMMGVSTTEATEPMMYDVWDLGDAAETIYMERFRGLNEYRVIFPNLNGDKLRFSNAVTNVRGEADLVLQHKETAIKFGVEMKSYYGFWGAMDVAGYDAAAKVYNPAPYIQVGDPRRTRPGFPKITNLLQTCLYLEEFWDDNIKLWKIIYVARDKGPAAEFDVTLVDYEGKRCPQVNGVVISWISLEGIHERYQKLGEYISKKQLPPRDYLPEYDPDIFLTGIVPNDLDPWARVKHVEWKKSVEDKASRARTEKKKKEILADGQTKVKRDWQCAYCPYLTRCLNEGKQERMF